MFKRERLFKKKEFLTFLFLETSLGKLSETERKLLSGMLNATTELKDSDFAKKHLKEKIDQSDDYEESQSSETNNKQTDRRGYAVKTNTIIQMSRDSFQKTLNKAM